MERKRKDRGGGLAIGCYHNLEPFEICQSESEDSEILIVEAKIGSRKIRFLTAYGPQEPSSEEEKRSNWIFYNNFEQAIIKSHLSGASVIIELDANAKLGSQLVPGDPHQQSVNGSILAGIISRQNLIVCNSLSLTTGVITRQRTTINGEEESVIDFMLCSNDLMDKIESVEIDEARKYTLTRFAKVNGCSIIKESDHNPIIGKFKLSVKSVTKERIEMFNLRNTECQAKYREFTNDTDILSCSIRDDEDINTSFERFLKNLNKIFYQTFKKIRVCPSNRLNEVDILMGKRIKLKNRNDDASKKELKDIEAKLVEMCAAKNMEIIKDEIDKLGDKDGGVNMSGFWKLKSKLFNKYKEPSAAKLDSQGHLVTGGENLKNLFLETYEKRLENRTIKPGLEALQKNKKELFDL